MGLLLFLFLKTEFGMAMRAVGANQLMSARPGHLHLEAHDPGHRHGRRKLCAGGGAGDGTEPGLRRRSTWGSGVLLNGLAALIVGETLFRPQDAGRQIMAPVFGAIVYYQVISMALALGLEPSDLKFPHRCLRTRHARHSGALPGVAKR